MDDLAVLDVLLTEHHRQFVALYPEERLISKMHFLLHTPSVARVQQGFDQLSSKCQVTALHLLLSTGMLINDILNDK